ncbi:AAA family ATPase [Nocardiopsis sp. B62]|uniref:AAA family ATPase n=1 Tax=Nocardiopsis sp. B62 TaxID=2824874 RepID=UPI001B36410F|nr:AAA family ATPase [Nocardiopsis sp. B62]MBQ1080991.1 AAA family ATPase [Nocardiopsis sp. B62]
MIKRITYVKDFRCYQSWKQHPQAIDFQRLNVIYAPNGTGKSTLATLLSGVPEDTEWSHGLKVLIQPEGSEKPEAVAAPGHWIWEDVRVFGADYVRRNLRFDSLDAETGAPALMYFGAPNVEQKQRREQTLERIQELTTRSKDLQKQYNRAENGRKKTLREVGARAVNELSAFNPRFRRGFDARHVEPALREALTPWDELARFAEQDRTLLVSQAWKPVPELADPGLATQDLWERVNEVRGRTVTSNVIEELDSNRSYSTWAQTGLTLHDGRNSCLFCDSPIESARIRRLEEHFDEGFTRLDSEITALHELITNLRRRAERIINDLPQEVQFFEHLQGYYETAVKQVRGNIQEFLLLLEQLAGGLDEKKGSMVLPLAPLGTEVLSSLDLSAVSSLIAEHNEGVSNQDRDRAQAAERRFHQMLYDVRGVWQEYCNERASYDDQLKACADELHECREVLKESPVEGMNPEHFLSRLNDDIAHLLRRKELSFAHVDGNYRVLRDGEPARHLSEGEKTAIALLYFLKSLEEKGRELERTIVVVDDPVSSLDDDLMKAVHSTLITRLDPGFLCRQLFVLTHSTTFLRCWRDSLTAGKDRKKWQERGTLHFMKSRRVTDPRDASRGIRVPVLDPIKLDGPQLNALSTEYALVFHRAARDLLASLTSTSVDDDVQLATSTPNHARKILEHFFQYRFPKQGEDVTAGLNEALKDKKNKLDSLRRDRLKAYVHNNSHRSPKGDDWQLLDQERRDALVDVFALIQQLDPEHFNGMCARLDLTHDVPLLTGQ